MLKQYTYHVDLELFKFCEMEQVGWCFLNTNLLNNFNYRIWVEYSVKSHNKIIMIHKWIVSMCPVFKVSGYSMEDKLWRHIVCNKTMIFFLEFGWVPFSHFSISSEIITGSSSEVVTACEVINDERNSDDKHHSSNATTDSCWDLCPLILSFRHFCWNHGSQAHQCQEWRPSKCHVDAWISRNLKTSYSQLGGYPDPVR